MQGAVCICHNVDKDIFISFVLFGKQTHMKKKQKEQQINKIK